MLNPWFSSLVHGGSKFTSNYVICQLANPVLTAQVVNLGFSLETFQETEGMTTLGQLGHLAVGIQQVAEGHGLGGGGTCDAHSTNPLGRRYCNPNTSRASD